MVGTKKKKRRKPDDDGDVITDPPYPPDLPRQPVQWIVSDHTEPHRITVTPSDDTLENLIEGE